MLNIPPTPQKSYGAPPAVLAPSAYQVAVPYSLISYVVVSAHESSAARVKSALYCYVPAPVLTRYVSLGRSALKVTVRSAHG